MINKETLQMCMISQNLFNMIKDAKRVLIHKISYDKQHNINIDKDTDFSNHQRNNQNIPLYKITSLVIPLQQITNIDMCNNRNGEINLKYHNSIRNLNMKQVLNIINKLLKLGRVGIAKRNAQNARVIWHINEEEESLDLE